MVQINNTPINLRVKFSKVGKLQYISHLDLVRTMMKIIVRAKLPLWYTEGFNPKPKIVFAAPLSIGTESLCEFMDIRLSERIAPEEAMLRLNANMTEEMQISEAYYPEMKLTELKWLGYAINFEFSSVNEQTAEEVNKLLSSPALNVMKKGKSGEREVDIKPLINEYSVSAKQGRLTLKCVLSADASNFLNPELIVKLLKSHIPELKGENLAEDTYSILRTAAFRADMCEFR